MCKLFEPLELELKPEVYIIMRHSVSTCCDVGPVSEFISVDDNSLDTQVENIQIAAVSAKRIQLKAKCIFKSAMPGVRQEVVLS